MRSIIVCVLAVVFTATIGSSHLLAGSPTPPAGPVAGTMKTLDEVEPSTPINATNTPGDADATYVITQPGPYHLTGHILGEVGKHGIQIVADDVSIDLRGFSVVGVAGSLDGIESDAGAPIMRNHNVSNGAVNDWDGAGVNLSNSELATVLAVTVAGNSGDGIVAHVVIDCKVDGGDEGIVSTGIVKDSVVQNTSGHGILLADGSQAINCSASNSGLRGIVAGARARIDGCSVLTAGDHGITIGDGSTVMNSIVRSAGLDGILGGNQATIVNCQVDGAGQDGIEVVSSGYIKGCTVWNAGNDGIRSAIVGTIDECIVRSTQRFGISGGESSLISNNTINNTVRDGIYVLSRCTVRGNTLDYIAKSGSWNASGIQMEFDLNRIDGNAITRCDYGIRAFIGGNVVINNSVADASLSAFDIPAGNAVGVIQNAADVAATPSANANFVY